MSQLPIESAASQNGSAGTRPQQQRRFARAPVSLPGHYLIEGKDAKVAGEIVNLGGGGLRFASTEDLERGSVVSVQFALPQSGREISTRCKVVLSFYEGASSRFAHGVAFTQIAAADQQAITAYVESLQHESADI